MKYAIAIVMLVTIAVPTASAQRECGAGPCGFGQGGQLTVIGRSGRPTAVIDRYGQVTAVPPIPAGGFYSSDCTPYYGAAKQACLKQKVRR
jgi:hypothetical protein